MDEVEDEDSESTPPIKSTQERSRSEGSTGSTEKTEGTLHHMQDLTSAKCLHNALISVVTDQCSMSVDLCYPSTR